MLSAHNIQRSSAEAAYSGSLAFFVSGFNTESCGSPAGAMRTAFLGGLMMGFILSRLDNRYKTDFSIHRHTTSILYDVADRPSYGLAITTGSQLLGQAINLICGHYSKHYTLSHSILNSLAVFLLFYTMANALPYTLNKAFNFFQPAERGHESAGNAATAIPNRRALNT